MAETAGTKARAEAGGTDTGSAAGTPAKSMLHVELERVHKPLAVKLAKQEAWREKMLARRDGTDQTEVTRAELNEQAKSEFTADERTRVQRIEYGTYVAEEPIDVGNARAFNEGDPVPISTVEAHGWHETSPPMVRRVDGKG